MDKFITNLKVKNKLFFLFCSMLVLLVVTSLTSVVFFLQIQSRVEQFYTRGYQSRIYANQIMRNFEQVQKYTLLAIEAQDQGSTESYAANVTEVATELLQKLEYLKGVYTGSFDMAKLAEEVAAITPIRMKIVDLTIQGENQYAHQIIENEWIPAVNTAVELLQALIEDTKQQGDSMIYSLKEQIVIILIIVTVILGLSVLTGNSINRKIRKSMMKPVEDIKYAAQELAQGNFNLELNYESEDEFGDVVNAMKHTVNNQKMYIGELLSIIISLADKNLDVEPRVEYKGEFIYLKDGLVKTLQKLNETIRTLQDSSILVSQEAGQLAQTSQDLAGGATEQAGAVEELLETINDITLQVDQNTKSAAKANKKAQDADEVAQESSERMDEMVQAMIRISDTSRQIEMIIQSIENIAAQTNLLSLNAAIEAARAGEAGKGFAVVANEISELANQSAQAASDTKKLIADSIREVKNGNRIAALTAEALSVVRQEINEIKKANNNVMEDSEKQSEAMVQINEGVEHISAIVQTNALSAEESSETSEELAAQAVSLKELADEFILKNE